MPATVLDAGETEARDDEDHENFEPGEGGLDVGGVAGADDVKRGDEPRGSDGGKLRPGEMKEGDMGKEAEDSEGSEDSHQASGNGGNGGWLGDSDPGPGVEKGYKVSIGVAEEGVFAADAGLHGGDFGVAHGSEQGEETAHDPDDVDHARTAHCGHHLSRDEEDARTDDDADHDGSGVGGIQNAGQVAGGGLILLHGWVESSTRKTRRSPSRLPNRAHRLCVCRGGDRCSDVQTAWPRGCPCGLRCPRTCTF